MPISALAGLCFGVAVVSIGLYHFTVVGPQLRSIHIRLAGVSDRETLGEGVSVALLRSSVADAGQRVDERLEEIERRVKTDLHRIGFVRYNSFSDVGSDLSYTLALLNEAGDGVLLTSIYSREETRTFGKAVRKFVPLQDASSEEHSAIAAARASVAV
jgi:hypothetical protein